MVGSFLSSGFALFQDQSHLKINSRSTNVLMSPNIAIRIDDRHDDPVDILNQVRVLHVEDQFLNGVESSWQGDPLAAM